MNLHVLGKLRCKELVLHHLRNKILYFKFRFKTYLGLILRVSLKIYTEENNVDVK